jgi:hypothetical protein
MSPLFVIASIVGTVVGIALLGMAIEDRFDFILDITWRPLRSLYLCHRARKTMLNKWYKIGWRGERGVFLAKSCSYQTSYPTIDGYGYDFRSVRFSKDRMRIDENCEPITDTLMIESCEKALACSLEAERLLDEKNAEEARKREEADRQAVDQKILDLRDRFCKTKKLNS